MERRRLTEKEKEIIGKKCVSCETTEDLVYHHIVPLSFGGKDILSNICCLCNNCHYKLHHHGKEKKYSQSYSELIKQGISNSSKTSGRITGNIDKLSTELRQDIDIYLKNNPTLERFTNAKIIATKHNICINTFKKYCRLAKEGKMSYEE